MSSTQSRMTRTFRGTTVLALQHKGTTVMAGDGQVSLGETVVKSPGQKGKEAFITIRYWPDLREPRQMLLPCSNVWRPNSISITGTSLARRWSLQRTGGPTKCCAVSRRCCWQRDQERSFLISGTGDVIEPDQGIMAIGSGGPYALSAALALVRNSDLGALDIAREAMQIAASICVYTNTEIIIEEL